MSVPPFSLVHCTGSQFLVVSAVRFCPLSARWLCNSPHRHGPRVRNPSPPANRSSDRFDMIVCSGIAPGALLQSSTVGGLGKAFGRPTGQRRLSVGSPCFKPGVKLTSGPLFLEGTASLVTAVCAHRVHRTDRLVAKKLCAASNVCHENRRVPGSWPGVGMPSGLGTY